MNKNLITKILFSIAVIYIGVVAFMFLAQRKILYIPDKVSVSPENFGLSEFEMVSLNTADGVRLNAWYKPAIEGHPTVLYLHGNGGNLSYRVERYNALSSAGFGVLALSYRGYGGSEGSPTETGLYADADSALEFLKSKKVEPKSIIYFGESLGSSVAINVAKGSSPMALVMEAPFTSISSRASSIYWYLPVKLILLDKFDSIGKIAGISAPILILHGVDDNLVPIEEGRELLAKSSASIKKMVEFPGFGHIGLTADQIMPELLKFLAENNLFIQNQIEDNNITPDPDEDQVNTEE